MSSESPSGSVSPLSEFEIRYYHTGFYKALKRYRLMTLAGWLIVVTGCASFPVGWSVGRPIGLIEIILSSATVVAGLALVWQSVSSLDAYINIVLPSQSGGERHPAVVRVREMMHDVDQGGWQEANSAIRQLEELQHTMSLPSLQ